MSIRVKLIIWFSLLGVIPAILIGGYYGYKSERAIEQKVLDSSINSVSQTVTAIDDRLLYIENALSTSLQNDVILETLDTLPDLDVVTRTIEDRKVAKHFNALIFNSSYIKAIAIVSNKSQPVVYGKGTGVDSMSEHTRYFLDGKFSETQLYKDVINNPNEPVWAVIQTGNTRSVCLLKSITYFLYAKQIGVAALIVDENAFKDYSPVSNAGYTSYLTTPEGFDLQTMQVLENSDVQMNNDKKGEALSVFEAEDSFVVQSKLSNGWVYGNNIEKDYLYGDLRKTRSQIILFVCLISIGFFAMALAVSFTFGRRIEKLLGKFSRLEKSDFTVDKILNGNDELCAIENGYNKMLVQLAHSIDENYITQIEKKQAELTALQYQINPHFLYNILEIINSMALLHHAVDISEVAQCMGRLYRYNMSTSQNEVTTLADEIKLIEDYIYLQNIQFSGKLNVFYNIDDDAQKCKVIKFILQPVVENAIEHGFKDKKGMCCIELSANITPDGDLKIEIQDDGIGMNENALEEIRLGLLQQEYGPRGCSDGIGLKNVHARICLRFGKEYGISINSSENMGTAVKLLMPQS